MALSVLCIATFAASVLVLGGGVVVSHINAKNISATTATILTANTVSASDKHNNSSNGSSKSNNSSFGFVFVARGPVARPASKESNEMRGFHFALSGLPNSVDQYGVYAAGILGELARWDLPAIVNNNTSFGSKRENGNVIRGQGLHEHKQQQQQHSVFGPNKEEENGVTLRRTFLAQSRGMLQARTMAWLSVAIEGDAEETWAADRVGGGGGGDGRGGGGSVSRIVASALLVADSGFVLYNVSSAAQGGMPRVIANISTPLRHFDYSFPSPPPPPPPPPPPQFPSPSYSLRSTSTSTTAAAAAAAAAATITPTSNLKHNRNRSSSSSNLEVYNAGVRDNGINGIVVLRQNDPRTNKSVCVIIGAGMPGVLEAAAVITTAEMKNSSADSSTSGRSSSRGANAPENPTIGLRYLGQLNITHKAYDIDAIRPTLEEEVANDFVGVVVHPAGPNLLTAYRLNPLALPTPWSLPLTSSSPSPSSWFSSIQPDHLPKKPLLSQQQQQRLQQQVIPQLLWRVPVPSGWGHGGRNDPPATGCNRVRVRGGRVYVSCFVAGAPHGLIGVIDLASRQVVHTLPYIDVQPTGMIAVGRALIVSGGRDAMVLNLTAGALGDWDALIVATCGAACRTALMKVGQNAHTPTVSRDAAGRMLLILSGQIDNAIGIIEIRNPQVLALMAQNDPVHYPASAPTSCV